MKITARYWLAAVGLIWAGVARGALTSDDFERYTNNTPLNGTNQWGASSASVAAKTNYPHWGTKSAYLPVASSLSNVVNYTSSAATNQVWSDFFTVPRFYVSDTATGPAADPNATAQFYITSNGWWAVISKSGSIVTNIIQTNAYGEAITQMSEGSNWVHVSVLHNYTTKKWSFFVNDRPIALNLGFINDSSVTNYNWFGVQNGGGDAAWLDDASFSNRTPSTLTADTDRNGLPDAWEIQYFGARGVANPTNVYSGDGLRAIDKAQIRANPFDSNDPGAVPLAAALPFYDYFDRAPTNLYGSYGWNASPLANVQITNQAAFMGSGGVKFLAGQASHEILPNGEASNVWTHMVLKPIGVTESQGAPGAASTVSFYVDQSGVVKAWSSNSYINCTNVYAGNLSVQTNFTVPANQWVRFVTKSDYAARKWNLYAVNVNGAGETSKYARLIGYNLDFNANSSASTYQGLSITNLADGSVTSYLDNVEITMTTSPWIDTDGDGVPDWFEKQEYGDAAVTNAASGSNAYQYAWGTTNTVVITNADLLSPTGMAVVLAVANLPPNQNVSVLASANPPTGGVSGTAVGSFNTGPFGTNTTFTDTIGVPFGGRVFYQIVGSTLDGNYSSTSLVTYAAYSQSRATSNKYYWVTIPVDYGTNNTLDRVLGKHLARGLARGPLTSADKIQIVNDSGDFSQFYLNSSTNWISTTDLVTPATQALQIGKAVLVERGSSPAPRTDSVFIGLQQTNQIDVAMHGGWNMVGWAYDNTSRDWGFTNGTASYVLTNGDFIYMVRNDNFIPIRLAPPNTWRVGYTLTGTPATNSAYTPLATGEGLLYRRAVTNTIHWTPRMP